MKDVCLEVANKLKEWECIKTDWNDQKEYEIEKDYIEQMECELNHMFDQSIEIDKYLIETERKLQEIMEGGIYV